MGIFERSKNHIVRGDPGGRNTILRTHETGVQTEEKESVRYIHSNDVPLPSLHSPRNFFIREVQTGLIVGCIRSRPRQFLASRRELIR